MYIISDVNVIRFIHVYNIYNYILLYFCEVWKQCSIVAFYVKPYSRSELPTVFQL